MFNNNTSNTYFYNIQTRISTIIKNKQQYLNPSHLTKHSRYFFSRHIPLFSSFGKEDHGALVNDLNSKKPLRDGVTHKICICHLKSFKSWSKRVRFHRKDLEIDRLDGYRHKRQESTKLTMHMNSLDVSQVIMWAFEKSLCTIRSSLAKTPLFSISWFLGTMALLPLIVKLTFNLLFVKNFET